MALPLNSCYLSTQVLSPTPSPLALSSHHASAPRAALCQSWVLEPTSCKLRGRGRAFYLCLDFTGGYFPCFVRLQEQKGSWLLVLAVGGRQVESRQAPRCTPALPAVFGMAMLFHGAGCASLMAPCPQATPQGWVPFWHCCSVAALHHDSNPACMFYHKHPASPVLPPTPALNEPAFFAILSDRQWIFLDPKGSMVKADSCTMWQ